MEIKSETITVRDLLELKKNSMLTVNPEYQRAAVWKEDQNRKLIDSVMRRYPLPLFYFHHKVRNIAGMQSEGLEIIDGQQRTMPSTSSAKAPSGCSTLLRTTKPLGSRILSRTNRVLGHGAISSDCQST